MFRCPECGIIWTRNQNNRFARFHEEWDENREKWFWTTNVPSELCPDCKRKVKR